MRPSRLIDDLSRHELVPAALAWLDFCPCAYFVDDPFVLAKRGQDFSTPINPRSESLEGAQGLWKIRARASCDHELVKIERQIRRLFGGT